jgi:hypothetical protein
MPEVKAVLDDGSASNWLKASLRSALLRDPVDALNDALYLASLLDARLRIVLQLTEASSS